MTEKIKKQFPTLHELCLALGCNKVKLNNIHISKEDLLQYDNLVELTPTENVMKLICYYGSDPLFNKIFICLILDRKIYESLFCDSLICTTIYCKLILQNDPDNESLFLQDYLQVVDKGNYFLHYRLIRLLPNLKNALIERLFKENQDTKLAQFVKTFNKLFDEKMYRDLLYFVLFIYGSDEMPFGNSKTTEYFKDCVYDMTQDGTNDVELSLMKGVLNLFYQINEV